MIFPRPVLATVARAVFLVGLLTSLQARPLVPNGGFEKGEEGWTLFSPAGTEGAAPTMQIVSDGARAGKNLLRLSSASPARFAAAHAPLPVSEGYRYRVAVWVRAAPGVDYTVGPLVRVIFREAAPSKVETFYYLDVEGLVAVGASPTQPRPAALPSVWKKIEAVIEAPKGAASARPALFAWGTRGVIDFDDFTMQPVPRSTPLTLVKTPASDSADTKVSPLQKIQPLDTRRVREIAGYLSARPGNICPPFSDRGYWENVGRLPAARTLLEDAKAIRESEPPELTEALFNDFLLTGQRRPYELPYGIRTNRLVTLVLAECVAPDEAQLAQIVRELDGVMDEPTWVVPAHARKFSDWHAAREFIDLAASARGWTLANIDWLLGDRLPRATRDRIREEVGARILRPWMARIREGHVGDFWWMKVPMNWSAVCNSGVLGSALLLLESPLERAEFITAWEQLNPDFLSGFTADGYCAEGVGYWGYGFGHFLIAGDLVHHVTGGRVDPLASEHVRKIMAYASEMEIANRWYPSFSDSTIRAKPEQYHLDFGAVRFGLGTVRGQPALKGNSILGGRMHVALFDLTIARDSVAKTASQPLPLRSWFPEGGALVCRLAEPGTGLAVALKGGHNDEPHNHNDLGSFVVISDGQLALADIGRDDYVNGTFGPLRYTSGVMGSFGHSVPRVAGKSQSPGADARAVTVRTEFTPERDLWEIDLTSAYAVPELKRLTRTFIFDRANGGSLEVVDEAVFASPQSFGIAFALLPEQRWVAGPDNTHVVEGGPGSAAFSVLADHASLVRSEEPIRGIVPGAAPKGLRIGFELTEPAARAVIRTRITPAVPHP